MTYTPGRSVEKTVTSQVFFDSQDEAPLVALTRLLQHLARVFQCVEMSPPTAVWGDASCECQPAGMPPSGREAMGRVGRLARGKRGALPQVPASCPWCPHRKSPGSGRAAWDCGSVGCGPPCPGSRQDRGPEPLFGCWCRSLLWVCGFAECVPLDSVHGDAAVTSSPKLGTCSSSGGVG